jgi:hypothetical protein
MAKGISLNIQIAYVNDWLKIEFPVDAFAIKSVKLTFKTNANSVVFIDRLEVLAKSHFTRKLTLEKLSTELTRDYAISRGEFGSSFDTLHDTINEELKAGDAALSIVAKQ